MTYTAVSHQGVIQMIWPHLWGAVMSYNFIYSLWIKQMRITVLVLEVWSCSEADFVPFELSQAVSLVSKLYAKLICRLMEHANRDLLPV